MNKGKYILIFFIYLVVGFLLYNNTIQAQFLSDSFYQLWKYRTYGAEGLLHSFYSPSLKYFYHLISYSGYCLFGTNEIAWHMLSVLLHAVNGTLVCLLAIRMMPPTRKKWVGFIAGFLFVISPYQTETVVWFSTLHYLMATFMTLLGCLLFTTLNGGYHRMTIASIHLLFFLGALTHESALILPGLLFILFLMQNRILEKDKVRSYLKYFLGPQLILLFIYPIATKLHSGEWAGHYGDSVHLNISLLPTVSTLNKYLLKFVIFFRYLPWDGKEILLSLVTKRLFLYAEFVFLLSLIGSTVYQIIYKRYFSQWSFFVLLFFLFVIALLPVINLETPFIRNIQADRYGYLPSVFFYMLLTFLIYQLHPRLSMIIFLAYVVLEIGLLRQTTNHWQVAGKLAKSLVEEFTWTDNDAVYILNLPDNYNGVYVFRNAFSKALSMRYDKDLIEVVQPVSMYNMFSLEDSVKIEAVGFNKLKITIGRPGQWFSLRGFGLRPKETDLYKVTMKDECYCYFLELKTVNNAVVIYQKGLEWKELKLPGKPE